MVVIQKIQTIWKNFSANRKRIFLVSLALIVCLFVAGLYISKDNAKDPESETSITYNSEANSESPDSSQDSSNAEQNSGEESNPNSNSDNGSDTSAASPAAANADSIDSSNTDSPSENSPAPPDESTPPDDTPPISICGTAGYGGNGPGLPSFASLYPGAWRSDFQFASIWGFSGQTFENFLLTSNVDLISNNVTLRNFYVNPGGGYYVIRTDDREEGAGSTITNGTIAASGATDSSLYKGITAWVNDLTISDMDISGTHDGITIGADNISISNVCIHDLANTPNAHNDGIEVYGGSNITISNSEIHNTNGQTSAINITNDGGAINEVLIENVTLSGGGYTIYVRGDGASSGSPVTNIRFRNVTITSPGTYGYLSYQSAPGAIVEWDVKDASGSPIPLN